MAGKALKASGKRVMKYSRDGAVERDLAENSESWISGRTEDAVLKVEHTDERFNAHGTVPKQPETEQKHRRHNPSDVQEQPQNTENGQSNSDLKFEDKAFKFDDTDIPAPAANETVPVEIPAPDETPAVPDNGEQQPETPQNTVAAQVIADHSDDTGEIPQDSFIIENLFADFYGSDEAPASGSKSDKFSFRQEEQPTPDTGKKRKAGRLQEDTHSDSKLKAETTSASLKQDAAKSGLMFSSENAVKPAESIKGETAEMTDGESGSKLSHKRRQRRDEPDDDALTEESESADTLKFEHTDRNLEKQSHFADKLSTGSSASKKLSESKLPREEISEEEQARQNVRKRQRKSQQAEQAKKKAETTVDDKAFGKGSFLFLLKGMICMQLVVCEKPSVGATLAKALGASDHKNGYIEGDNIIVSWCIGHLVELASADCYDERYKKWSIEDLPIIPLEWQYIVSAGKNEQFEVLRGLMNDSSVTEVVNACDAGREGELIFRLVYNKIGCTKPVKRLWLSSMEEKAIIAAFADLKDGREYDNLYRSALCRSKADWIVGINSTRLFSKMYNKKLNVGRVQTPTLAILLEREKSIADFKKEKYYTVKLKADGLDAVSEKVTDEGEAKRIAGECSGKSAVVKSVKTERKTVNPPKLYDLTTLQRDAMKPMTPIEYFDTFAEAKQRFDELRGQAYNSETVTNEVTGRPPARLALGIESDVHKAACDILHVCAGENVLLEDFARMPEVRSQQEAVDLVAQTAKEIGFDTVSHYEKLPDGSYPKEPEMIPFEKWDNPYFKVEREKPAEKSEHTPIYTHSLEYARSHNEMPALTRSMQANRMCAFEINHNADIYAVSAKLDKLAEKLVEKYGFERSMYVLAHNIQHDNLKKLLALTKETDTFYLEKRKNAIQYDPKGAYDFDSWKDKFTSEIKTIYEKGLNDLIYNDKKRNFDDVFRTFSEINSILKSISE